jgi:hypothetical protein
VPDQNPQPTVDLAEVIEAGLRRRAAEEADRPALPPAGPASRGRRDGRTARGGRGGRNVRQYAFRRS